MSADSSDLGEKLDAMALGIVEDVAGESLEMRVNAFKALSQFYISRKKVDNKEPEETETSFDAMRKRVQQAGGAEGK